MDYMNKFYYFNFKSVEIVVLSQIFSYIIIDFTRVKDVILIYKSKFVFYNSSREKEKKRIEKDGSLLKTTVYQLLENKKKKGVESNSVFFFFQKRQ